LKGPFDTIRNIAVDPGNLHGRFVIILYFEPLCRRPSCNPVQRKITAGVEQDVRFDFSRQIKRHAPSFQIVGPYDGPFAKRALHTVRIYGQGDLSLPPWRDKPVKPGDDAPSLMGHLLYLQILASPIEYKKVMGQRFPLEYRGKAVRRPVDMDNRNRFRRWGRKPCTR